MLMLPLLSSKSFHTRAQAQRRIGRAHAAFNARFEQLIDRSAAVEDFWLIQKA